MTVKDLKTDILKKGHNLRGFHKEKKEFYVDLWSKLKAVSLSSNNPPFLTISWLLSRILEQLRRREPRTRAK